MSLPPHFSPLGEPVFEEKSFIDPFTVSERSKTVEHGFAQRSNFKDFSNFEKSRKQSKIEDIES